MPLRHGNNERITIHLSADSAWPGSMPVEISIPINLAVAQQHHITLHRQRGQPVDLIVHYVSAAMLAAGIGPEDNRLLKVTINGDDSDDNAQAHAPINNLQDQQQEESLDMDDKERLI